MHNSITSSQCKQKDDGYNDIMSWEPSNAFSPKTDDKYPTVNHKKHIDKHMFTEKKMRGGGDIGKKPVFSLI